MRFTCQVFQSDWLCQIFGTAIQTFPGPLSFLKEEGEPGGDTTVIVEPRGRCVSLKLRRNISGPGTSLSYWEKHELLCMYSLLDVANHTEDIYIQ